MWLALPHCSILHSGGHRSSSLSTHWQSSLSNLVDFCICHQHESDYYWFWGGSGCKILISAPPPGPSISLQLQMLGCMHYEGQKHLQELASWVGTWKGQSQESFTSESKGFSNSFCHLNSGSFHDFIQSIFKTDVKWDTVNIFWDYF